VQRPRASQESGKKDIIKEKGSPSSGVLHTQKEKAPQPQVQKPQLQAQKPQPPKNVTETKTENLNAGHKPQATHQHQTHVFQPQRHEPEQPPKKQFVDSDTIPASYNSTNLALIAKDPHWLYAYWEIAPSSTQEIKNKIGQDELNRSSYVLRVYDVTYVNFNGHNANHSFDLDVGAHANSWYINLWNDNTAYCGDLGIRTPDGRFFQLARSNFVSAPRVNMSGRSDLIWMNVKDDAEEAPYVFGETPQQRAFRQARQRARRAPLVSRGPGRKIFLTEKDIRAYYSKLFPLLSKVLSMRRRDGKKPDESRIYYIKDKSFHGVSLEKFLLRGLSRGEFIKKILLGASENLILLGASEAKQGASERQKKQRKFFFEIGTELIVYGRTEPDAEVWLGDKQIKLRNDGTFSLRFALPDKKIPLDFVAISNDKVEKRRITTEVERKKTIYGSEVEDR